MLGYFLNGFLGIMILINVGFIIVNALRARKEKIRKKKLQEKRSVKYAIDQVKKMKTKRKKSIRTMKSIKRSKTL